MITYNVQCDNCNRPITTEATTKAAALKTVKAHDFITVDGQHLCAKCAELIGYLVKCHGEAHSNPYIDKCSVCAPRWGLVPV